MNTKKFMAGAVASVMALSTMAVAANAAALAVDQSKVYVGDLEGKGNIRIEIYNEYGAQDSAIDRDAIAAATQIAVTFTIAGVPAGNEYDAVLGYADGSWATQDWESSVKVTGDGTYTITSNFAPWADEDTGEEVPAEANGAIVFVIDIKGLATDTNAGSGAEGFEFEDSDFAGKAQFAKDAGVIVSDVQVEVTAAGAAADEGDTAPADGNEDGAADDGAAEETQAPAADNGNTSNPTTDKQNANTGVEGVAVVAGLAIVAAGAVVVANKRK